MGRGAESIANNKIGLQEVLKSLIFENFTVKKIILLFTYLKLR